MRNRRHLKIASRPTAVPSRGPIAVAINRVTFNFFWGGQGKTKIRPGKN